MEFQSLKKSIRNIKALLGITILICIFCFIGIFMILSDMEDLMDKECPDISCELDCNCQEVGKLTAPAPIDLPVSGSLTRSDTREVFEIEDYVADPHIYIYPACISFGDPMASICWKGGEITYEGNFTQGAIDFLEVLRYQFGLECPPCGDEDYWNQGFHKAEMICEELLDECGYND